MASNLKGFLHRHIRKVFWDFSRLGGHPEWLTCAARFWPNYI